MSQVIDRTRPAKFRKGCQQPLRYEVVIFHREEDYESQTGIVVAKFAAPGDAFIWAKQITDPCHCIVVRN